MRLLINKLEKKQATIAIVGLGYVGLPLMLRYSTLGYQVIGIDVDQQKIDNLQAGKSYIEHINSSFIETALSQGFTATTDFSSITKADAIILCIPTPLNKHREPDLSYVLDTLESLLPYIHKNQVLSLESTTYPGTTEEQLLPRIESTGLKVGDNFYLVYSPEREDPGNQNYQTSTIPKVCGGQTDNCLKVGIALYQQAIKHVVPVSSTKAAEMTKLLENIYRAVNIGLVNEMKMVADKMDIDIHEVIKAASTKPFGFTPYYPGPGLGGHCIPIDPFYLTWKAREYGMHTRFIELAGEVNHSMPEWVINKIFDALNQKGKAINGSSILILGVAYKPDVDDTRESPAFVIMDILSKKGAKIDYSDPHVLKLPKKREYSFNLSSIELNKENLNKYDCTLIVTNHSLFDYDLIQQNSRLVVDTRGVYSDVYDNVVKA
jgi:UDP-N-acetyl-D-glucosamine dehydrogenase